MKTEIEWQKINGWLSHDEGMELFRIARNGPGNGVIVEIGSWQGRSTICLAMGSRGDLVYTVDPHQGTKEHKESGIKNTLEILQDNIKKYKLEKIIRPIIKTSKQAFDGWIKKPIRLLFIDGGHLYEDVKLDLILWTKELIDGGVLAIHDVMSDAPGVIKAVDELIKNNNQFIEKRQIQRTLFVIKRKGEKQCAN